MHAKNRGSDLNVYEKWHGPKYNITHWIGITVFTDYIEDRFTKFEAFCCSRFPAAVVWIYNRALIHGCIYAD